MHQNYNQVLPLGCSSPNIKGTSSGRVNTRKQQGLVEKMLCPQRLPDTPWDTPTAATTRATESLCIPKPQLSSPPASSAEHRDKASSPKHVPHQLFMRVIWKITGNFFYVPLLSLSPKHHTPAASAGFANKPYVLRASVACRKAWSSPPSLQPTLRQRRTLGTACPLLVSLSSVEGQGLGGHS